MNCPRCKSVVSTDARYCGVCGLPMTDSGSPAGASFLRRALAMAIDWPVWFVIGSILGGMGAAVLVIVLDLPISREPIGTVERAEQLAWPVQAFFMTMTGLGWLTGGFLYYVGFERSRFRATPGKRLMGLQVTDLAGARLGWGRATGRYAARYLSNASLGVGYLLMLVDDRKQTLHDRLSGCLVTRRSPP